MLPERTIHKIFETTLAYEKSLISDFNSFSLVLTKFSLWQENWALGYHSMGFRHFPDIS